VLEDAQRAEIEYEERRDVHRQVSAAKTYLMMRYPFYSFCLRMRVVLSREVPVAAIRKDATCFINPGVFGGLELSEQAALLAHEICHVALGHFDRRQHRDQLLWNHSCDIVINNLLVTSGLPLPLGLLADAGMNNLSAEEVYARLDGTGKRRTKKVAGFRDCDFEKWDAPLEEGPDQPWEATIFGPLDWARLIQQAGTENFRGTLPAEVARWAGSARAPSLPWRVLLARYLQHASARSRGSSYRYPSRRSGAIASQMPAGTTTILPGPSRGPCEVVVAVDTSGSMSSEAIAAAMAEVKGILGAGADTVRLIACDAKIHLDTTLSELRGVQLTGGGGSRSEPVFSLVRDASLLVYLTDLELSIPAKPPSYPVLWVATRTHSRKPPFGTVISMRM
jgi:predicted metal-dependent peptidase